jgi:hypothetical protein
MRRLPWQLATGLDRCPRDAKAFQSVFTLHNQQKNPLCHCLLSGVTPPGVSASRRLPYGTIAVSTLIGVVINVIGLDPIRALFWAAVSNGVVAVLLTAMIMPIARGQDIIRPFESPRMIRVMGRLCTGTMAVAVGIMAAAWRGGTAQRRSGHGAYWAGRSPGPAARLQRMRSCPNADPI